MKYQNIKKVIYGCSFVFYCFRGYSVPVELRVLPTIQLFPVFIAGNHHPDHDALSEFRERFLGQIKG